MAIIKPFAAIRPNTDLADQIAALPYDVMNTAEAKTMVADNEYSFLRIDRGEVNFTEDIDPHDEKVYAKAAQRLQKMISEQAYIQDSTPKLYIYRQIMNNRAQTGLVCCTAVDDYLNNVIKKHEFTRPDKEQDRVNHIEALNAQTGPIFQTYRNNDSIETIIAQWTEQNEPVYDFAFTNNVTQQVWVIDSEKVIADLVAQFTKIDTLYIADGHHRSAAAYRVAQARREANPNYTGDEEFNYFLSVLFPASELYIMSYNRVVHDLAGHSEVEFLNAVAEKFFVIDAPSAPYQPQAKQTYGMHLGKKWYKLTPKPAIVDQNHPINRLDVAILQDHLLAPILGIKDPRTDNRIDFIGGIRGVEELEKRVATDMKVAFSLYPTAIYEVMDVADENMVMPPKSTWFEPKLLSGIFIHKIEE